MTRRSTRNFRRIIASSNRRRSAAGEPPALTYEGAYINRSGETGASDKTISLKFTESVLVGSNYTTGMTIEVTGDNGASYSTIDLSNTTQAVVNSNYVQYTLTGTVDTFQGLTGTTGHQVKISYDGSQSWNSSTITNVTTLTNASTINLLSNVGEIWHMENVNAAIDSANNMTNVNTVTFVAGKLDDAGDFERSSNQYFEHTDSAGISIGDNSFTYACWIKLESTGVWQGIATDMTWLGTGTPSHHLALSSGNKILGKVWGTSSDSGNSYSESTLESTGTWYHVALIHDKGTDVKIALNGSVETTTTYTGGGKDGTNDLVFGGYSGGNASGAFDGLIDEMTWLSKAISTAELTDLYNDGNGKAYPYLPDTI